MPWPVLYSRAHTMYAELAQADLRLVQAQLAIHGDQAARSKARENLERAAELGA